MYIIKHMNKKHALHQLDKELMQKALTSIHSPKSGWIRTIRKATGMTIKQLAKRIGVNPSRVVRMETDEPHERITLQTLQAAAQAMNCRLVYAFAPKEKSLTQLIQHQAEKAAIQQLQTVDHSMQLEKQGVINLTAQKNKIVEELLKHSWKHLWDDDEI
jgi:predicted DNA-binding mobile mystery protein A